jgi:cold shock CspA family protein
MDTLNHLQPGLEVHVGLVRWFDNRQGKQFGFIAQSWRADKKDDTFFHLNDGLSLVKGKEFPILTPIPRGMRAPEIGDSVAFRISQGSKDPKASPWAYLHDYEELTRAIIPQRMYRLVGHYPLRESDASNRPMGVTFWSGLGLERLYVRFPECQKDLGNARLYVRNTANVEDIHLEVVEAGEEAKEENWKRM